MTKALLVLPVLVAACAEAPTATQPSPTTAPIAFTVLGNPQIVATGGYQVVTIADQAEAGLAGSASDGYEVEPFGDVWPNFVKPEYHVRALQAGHGTFSIATSHGVAAGAIESADVARVALLPVDYALTSGYTFAVDPARPEVEVVLFDDQGRRLVDGSLTIAGAKQTAWNRIRIDTPTTLTISADSIETVALTVAGGADYDRIVEIGNCVHAYRGELEVVSAQLAVQQPSESAINCW
jgi:hypothetical protein